MNDSFYAYKRYVFCVRMQRIVTKWKSAVVCCNLFIMFERLNVGNALVLSKFALAFAEAFEENPLNNVIHHQSVSAKDCCNLETILFYKFTDFCLVFLRFGNYCLSLFSSPFLRPSESPWMIEILIKFCYVSFYVRLSFSPHES